MYKEFNTYQLYFYAKPAGHRFVQVYMNGVNIGMINFNDTSSPPANSVDAQGRIRLNMHTSDFDAVVDLMRNESPVYMWINEKNGIGGISTSANEPVGEGE